MTETQNVLPTQKMRGRTERLTVVRGCVRVPVRTLTLGKARHSSSECWLKDSADGRTDFTSAGAGSATCGRLPSSTASRPGPVQNRAEPVLPVQSHGERPGHPLATYQVCHGRPLRTRVSRPAQQKASRFGVADSHADRQFRHGAGGGSVSILSWAARWQRTLSSCFRRSS